MKKIFLDTNILLDVLLQRDSFMQNSARVWAECESGKVKGFISAISLNNMHFIMSKRIGKDRALESVRICLSVFSVVPLDEKILRLAVELPHKDFEDAIQLFSAVQMKVDCIVTRDAGHFSSEYLPILSPGQYADLSTD